MRRHPFTYSTYAEEIECREDGTILLRRADGAIKEFTGKTRSSALLAASNWVLQGLVRPTTGAHSMTIEQTQAARWAVLQALKAMEALPSEQTKDMADQLRQMFAEIHSLHEELQNRQ